MSISSQLRTHLGVAMAHPGVAKEVRNLLGVLSGQVASATFTIGAESVGNAIVVSIQLKDDQGSNIAARKALDVLLLKTDQSDFNTNDYTVAAGTNGKLSEVVADKVYKGLTNATGALDVSLTIAGAATCSVAVVLPSGQLAVSNAVIHAA